MASYSPYIDATWPFTTSTIPPLYDPAYTDTEVTPIVINKLTQSQYESITPDNTQLYLVTDANFETTNHKVQSIDASSTNTQYPSATAVNDVKYRGEPFYIEADGGAISFAISGTMPSKHIAYSFDKVTWTDTTIQNLNVNVPSTKRVYFRSNDTTNLAIDVGGRAFTGYAQFSISGDYTYKVGGRLDSLFNYASAGDTFMLFQQPSLITNAEDLDVNHEGTACICHGMFQGAYMLEKAPALSATTLQPYAYSNMFADCASLKEAPALPAETLLPFCYEAMFTYCTSLRFAPPIMAKTLAACCCLNMFSGCSSLETAPELYATTMVSNCYASMFSGCTNLKQIPRLYATELAASCYSNMFYRCSSLELQETADGTHYNIIKVPEKPKYDWTLIWNNSMVTAPDGTVTLPDTLNTCQVEAYKLPSSTTFNGSSNYIDTGIKILDTDKDFTVMIDFAYGTSPGQYNTAIDCMISASPYNRGLCLYYNNTEPHIYPIYYQSAPGQTADQNRHKVIFRHNAGDAAVATLFYDSATGVALNGSSYIAVNKNVYLGCRLQDSGSRDRYFKGTMYDARIYLESLSDTNIADLINGNEPTEPITPEYTIRGSSVTELVFSCNNINYDSMKADLSGNMYYGASGTYTKVYDVTNGWVNSVYQTLSISNDPDDFENKFINGDGTNLYDSTTITTGYYINSSGVKTTGAAASISAYIPVIPGHNYTWTGVAMESGTNNKRVAGYATTSTTTGTVINNVAVTGTNVPYENTFTVPTGLNYVRLSFNTVDTNIVLVDNDATSGSGWGTFKNKNLTINYSWDSRGLSITGMNFKSNNTNYNSLAVNSSGDTISYDSTPVYTSNGWTNSNYKTLTSSYNLGQHFTSTDWSSFFETNKNTNTSSTITVPSGALTSMFSNTGGTWTGTPVINKAYFTDAVLIPEANKAQTDAGYAEIWWKDALVTSGQSLYSLLTTTTFNGTSDYIDTNVKVLNGDPTFSIFVDFQQAALVSDMREVIHCNTEVSPYPGLSLDINPPSYTRLAYYNKVNNYTRDTNRHKAIITHTAGAKNVCTWYYDSTTAVPTTGTTAYSNVDRNLLIGCYQDANGNKGRFLNGTIYSCVVLDRIFTSAEISSLMSGSFPSTINWTVKNQILSVRFICNGILYDKLRIDSDGSMYYGRDNVFTIVYDVNTNTWDEDAKKIQVLSSISSTFINEWNAFLSQSKLY